MTKSRYTEGQIVKALKEEENGRSVMDISRELGINKQSFCNWKKKYAGMSGKHLRQLKQLQEENVRLKHMYADVSLETKCSKIFFQKSGRHWRSPHSRDLFGTEPPSEYYQGLQNFWVL